MNTLNQGRSSLGAKVPVSSYGMSLDERLNAPGGKATRERAHIEPHPKDQSGRLTARERNQVTLRRGCERINASEA